MPPRGWLFAISAAFLMAFLAFPVTTEDMSLLASDNLVMALSGLVLIFPLFREILLVRGVPRDDRLASLVVELKGVSFLMV